MAPELQQLLMSALLAVLTFVIAAAGIWFRAWLKKLEFEVEVKIGTEQLSWLKSYISDTVAALAQNPAFEEWSKIDLKEQAIQFVTAFCEEHNLPFSDEQIDILIESAVSAFNQWFKE